jgi:hypothetical protein
MVAQLVHAHANPPKKLKSPGWHRWHDSGDIQSVEHLTKLCAVAALTPHLRHWLPTQELAMVYAYQRQGGVIPDNLVIRPSDAMKDTAHGRNWPTTSGVASKGMPVHGRECPAPTQDNECGPCRACWSPEISRVIYHEH